MTAIPSISFPTMDNSHQDENMDFGSDLQFLDNDVEFDVDIMQDASRGPSVEPAQDAMIEDLQESAIEDVDIDEPAKATADDEMVDEVFMEDDKNNHEYQGLGEEQQSATMYDDDDLIYADEDEEAHVDVDFRDEDGSGGIHDNETEVDLLDEEQHVQSGAQETLVEGVIIPTQQSDKDAETSVQQESNVPSTGNEQAKTRGAFEDVSGANVVQEEATLGQSSEAEDATTGANPQVEQLSVVPPTDAESTKLGKGTSGNLTETPSKTKEDGASADGYEEEQDSDSSYDAQALHLVKVQYDGTELCLFPPLEGDDTFFVQDSSLAFSPCDQLLTACRDVLGESIGQGLELVLDFPTLGLHLPEVCPHSASFSDQALTVSQDSLYAKRLSLSQIMDVYLALRQNDREDPIPPLHCTLRTRISLASQMTFLLSAAADGKGHTHIQNQVQRQTSTNQLDLSIARTDNVATQAENGEKSDLSTATVSVEDNEKEVIQEQDIQDIVSQENPTMPADNLEAMKGNPSDDGTVTPISYPEGENFEGSEGESDISSALCSKPQYCLCETCFANILTDQDTKEVPDHTVPGPRNNESTTDAKTANEESSSKHIPDMAATMAATNATVSRDAESDSDQTVRGDPPRRPSDADASEGRHGVDVNDFALVQNDENQPLGSEGDSAEAGTSSSGTIENAGAGDTVADASSAVIDDGVDFEDEDNYDDSIGHEADDQEQEPKHPHEPTISQPHSTTGAVELSINENISQGNADLGSTAPEASALEDEFGDDNLDLPSDDDLLNVDDDTSSTGPSSKRKAFDEDDFDFLDPTTPEKKKSRPS